MTRILRIIRIFVHLKLFYENRNMQISLVMKIGSKIWSMVRYIIILFIINKLFGLYVYGTHTIYACFIAYEYRFLLLSPLQP